MTDHTLVVARDSVVLAALVRTLRPLGRAIELADNTKRARKIFSTGRVAFAVMVPDRLGTSGLELAREIGEAACLVIIAEHSRDIKWLERAVPRAALYLSKPLNERAMLERIRLVIARPSQNDAAAVDEVFRFEGRTLDLGGHSFINERGEEVPLTRGEFRLLVAFARQPARVLSRQQLQRAMGGNGRVEPYERGIDMLIGRLRRKIEPDPKQPKFIRTVPGCGYKFAAKPKTIDGTPGSMI